MRKKGRLGIENPEKLNVETYGIEMTRGTRATENPNAQEKLTGGQGVADESKVADLVSRFINHFR